MKRYRWTLALALTLTAGGCAQMGGLEEVLGGVLNPAGGQQGDIVAEVQQVDTRSRAIQVRTQDGRTGAVQYDDRTRVIYQQREYPVTALERGDIVALQVQQGNRGEPYVHTIHVQQSVQDRGGAIGGQSQLEVVEGVVDWVDRDQGRFGVRGSYGGSVIVSLPYNMSRADLDRFNRIRANDRVRVEGRRVESGRVELVRFL